jgi:hypothetical protein
MSNVFQQAPLNKASKDKFRLVFDIPPAMRAIDKKFEKKDGLVNRDSMQFSVYGAIVPEVIVAATEMRYAGSTLYNSSHSKDSFPPNVINFTVDNEFKNYWVIWKWLNMLHDEAEGIFDVTDLRADESYLQYQTDITISALDEFNNPIITWTYTKAFPTVLGGINYSDRDEGEIESSFTFVFSQLHAKLENTR